MHGVRSGHRGRVFYSYLLSFFLILIVPVATTVVATLPILLLYPSLQKYFVKGAMIGSVKG